MEVDDCLESALQCVRELTVQAPVSVSEQRSSLPVEPKVVTVIADTGDPDALMQRQYQAWKEM
ncbi:MAG TPA: hypothetical protein PK071_04635, partial [Atopobiaceae bacterium]|nr:hypothetical protein [Atopobiaceae bacterium]